MRDWQFSQETKRKQKFLANSEKEVGNFLKAGTIVTIIDHDEKRINVVKAKSFLVILGPCLGR